MRPGTGMPQRNCLHYWEKIKEKLETGDFMRKKFVLLQVQGPNMGF